MVHAVSAHPRSSPTPHQPDIILVEARAMIYIKSFLAGLVALFSLSALIVGAAFFIPVVMERLPLPAGVGVVSFPMWPIAAGVLLISGAVSHWTFQRARASRIRSRPLY